MACQRGFCCRLLAAAPLTLQISRFTFSCPWRKDGRTDGWVDKSGKDPQDGGTKSWKHQEGAEWTDGVRGEGISSGASWPKARQPVRGRVQRLYSCCLPLFLSTNFFFLSSCFFYNCLPGRLPPGLLFSSTSSSLCLHSLIPPQSAGWQVDCGHDGRYPFWVRQHFLSVPEARSCSIRVLGPALASSTVCEVQLLCSLTPPTTLVPAVLCLCKLQLTTRPCPLKICTAAVARRPDNI